MGADQSVFAALEAVRDGDARRSISIARRLGFALDRLSPLMAMGNQSRQ